MEGLKISRPILFPSIKEASTKQPKAHLIKALLQF
jgi:hypothetical protein